MSENNSIESNLDNKIKLVNSYLNTITNIVYLPFFYKIISLTPVDIYELFFSDDSGNRLILSGYTSQQCFNHIINFLFIDINILYDYLYSGKYKEENTNVLNFLGGEEDYKKKILNDTEKIYSTDNNKYGLINIIDNTDEKNTLIQKLYES